MRHARMLLGLTLAAVSATSLTAVSTAAPSTEQALVRPNIVLILTDDQSIESIQRMPYLQRGIDGGAYISFTNAEVNTSLCCPSRAEILSGQYDTNTGVLANDDGKKFDPSTSVAVALHDAGYRTGFSGKLFNSYDAGWGRPPGWDDFRPYVKGDVYQQYNYSLGGNGGPDEVHGNAPEDYAVDVLTQKALNFFDASRGSSKPFFYEVAPTATHTPFVPAPRHKGTFADESVPTRPNFNEVDVSDKPEWVQELEMVNGPAVSQNKRQQWEAALGVDDMLRSIEDRLRQNGQLDNTVVVFFSDNGLSQGAHRWGTKRCQYTECVNVPVAIRYPGVQGRTDTHLISNVDLAPTFLDLANATSPVPRDGVSLVRLLEDTTDTVSARSQILEHWGGGSDQGDYDPNKKPVAGFYSIRVLQWRYVEVTNLAAPGDVERELYNLADDPYELVNVVDRYPLRASNLQTRMYGMVAAGGGVPGAPQGSWQPGGVADPNYVWIDRG